MTCTFMPSLPIRPDLPSSSSYPSHSTAVASQALQNVVSAAQYFHAAQQTAQAHASAAAAARLAAAKRAMIAAGLAARKQREREVVRGLARRMSGVTLAVASTSHVKQETLDGLGRRMSAVDLERKPVAETVAAGAVGPSTTQRIYRRRMAIAGHPASLTRLRTDLRMLQPSLYSPATTEAAVMLTQLARSPPHSSHALPPLPRSRVSVPPLSRPTITRRMSLPARVTRDKPRPPPIMVPLDRKAWARRAVAVADDDKADLLARLEGGVLARRRGRLLKPLRLI